MNMSNRSVDTSLINDIASALTSELGSALTSGLGSALSSRLGSMPSQVSPEQVDQLCQQTGLSKAALTNALLPLVARLARVPVSDYRVGAIVAGQSGTLYFGANLELADSALNLSVHAEQSAIANAWLHGETGIDSLTVSASPCGHCRQFINELSGADQIQICLPSQPPQSIEQLLPGAFGPAQLGVKTALLADQGVVFASPNNDDALVTLATQQASQSYAPYSHCHSAVVLEMDSGEQVIGRYAENAAFNPSLGPMAMALNQLALRALSYQGIRRAVMVENANGKISQLASAEMALAAVTDIRLESHRVSN